MSPEYPLTQKEITHGAKDTFHADKTSTLLEVAHRRRVSITFLRREIDRGRLRALVLAPDSHRKKVRVLYRDEMAWLESNVTQPAK